VSKHGDTLIIIIIIIIIMWHKVRLLQMCEREKLPKLKTKSKLKSFKKK